MLDFPLSDTEAQLARAIADGLPFGSEDPPERTIRAEALRRILLGLPVTFDGETAPRQIRLPAGGACITHVTITGALRLDDASAPDGGPLPPLRFLACRFLDDISLRGAQIRHLSFAGSTFPRLAAAGLRVSGQLDLSAVSPGEATPSAGPPQCCIELREASIGGSLKAASAHFVAAPKAPAAGRSISYALDLRAAMIGNELELCPGFRATGGISLRSVRIDKDLIATGAAITVTEGAALSAAGAHIGGAVLCNVWASEDGPKPFTAGGDVSFLDARVDGSFEFRGAVMRGLVAINIKIGGGALLGAWESGETILRFQSRDTVSFYAATIAGTLDMAGASMRKLEAEGISIGGAARIRAYNGRRETVPCQIRDDIVFASARITGNLDISGTIFHGLSAPNVQIGGSVYLSTWEGQGTTFPCLATGNVLLTGANITGSLDASGATMRSLLVDNAEIGGAVFLRAMPAQQPGVVFPFTVQDDVAFMGSKIAGNLEMAGAAIGNLHAANARIGGAAILLALNMEHDTMPFRATGTVSLVGAKIGGGLEMNGATVDSLNAQNAEIGGSMFLRAWDGVASTLPFLARGEVFLLGARIGADLSLSGAILCGAVFSNNTRIGGNLWLTAWKQQALTLAAPLDLSGSEIKNSLIVEGIVLQPQAGLFIDLSHATVGVLDDKNGLAWGTPAVLRLEGFQYERLAITNAAAPAKRELKMLGYAVPLGHWAPPSPSADRLGWLRLQFPKPGRKPNITDYSPDVYDRLQRAFRASGYYAEARVITRERLRVERQIAGLSFTRPFQSLYAFFFDSGLSPGRAIATLLGFVAIGWGATYIADHGAAPLGLPPVLMLETSTMNSLVVPADDKSGLLKPGLPIGAAGRVTVSELPCGDAIDPLLYALDIFVPALEIHQEGRCAITSEPAGQIWRIARAIYAIIGWIVTALTVLTVSGVARRHLEG